MSLKVQKPRWGFALNLSGREILPRGPPSISSKASGPNGVLWLPADQGQLGSGVLAFLASIYHWSGLQQQENVGGAGGLLEQQQIAFAMDTVIVEDLSASIVFWYLLQYTLKNFHKWIYFPLPILPVRIIWINTCSIAPHKHVWNSVSNEGNICIQELTRFSKKQHKYLVVGYKCLCPFIESKG